MKIQAIKEHFKLRFAEWSVGLFLLVYGIALASAPGYFESSYLFGGMLRLAPQSFWVTACILVASIRLIFLIINGTWRRSAHLRTLGSGLSALIWTAMASSYLTLGTLIPGLAIIGIPIVLDLYSLWYAAEDAKHSDTLNKEARFIQEVNRRTP